MSENNTPNNQPRTIDERLDILARKVEGLTDTVELLGKMQIKTEREIRQLGRYVRILVQDHEARLLTLEGDEGETK